MTPGDFWLVGAGAIGLVMMLWSGDSLRSQERKNLYDQQKSNRRWSYVLVGVFALFVALLGLGVDVFYLRMPVPAFGLNVDTRSGRDLDYGTKAYWEAQERRETTGVPFATIIAVLASLLYAWMSFQSAPEIVLAAAGARSPNLNDPKEVQLVNVVRELCTAAGLPPPKVWVVPDDDLNAFATGTSPETAHVAVTEGLLQELDREELQGVMAHELSHVRNADCELMTLVVALAGAAALLSDFSRRASRSSSSGLGKSGKGKGGGGGALVLVWIALVVIAPLLSRLMAMAISRRREYLADASGAELTRNPVGLARALQKISGAKAPTQSMSADGFAHLCIDDPKGSAIDGMEGLIGDIFSTHPPIAKRIAALNEMGYLADPSHRR